MSFTTLFRSGSKRFRVWLVDDREENRETFKQRHSLNFNIETFETPEAVLQAIRDGREPDALLCDIYFIADPNKRENLEARVKEKVEELRHGFPELDPGNARGIHLISDVRNSFNESPRFPIYAYTSKGPYLLQREEFDQLENLDAKWLFKGKYTVDAERHRILSDIQEFRDRFSWSKRIWQIAIATGVVGSILGVLLDRLCRFLGF